MTEKNFDYYKKKTKADAAKRKAADPGREDRAKAGAMAAYFFAIGWRLLLINIWRILLIGVSIASLIFSVRAYDQYNHIANLPLIILFGIITIGIIAFTTATFWRRGLWVVTLIALVLGIFAFVVPFYDPNCNDDSERVATPAPEEAACAPKRNLYGQELNY